ncbi:MAG: hypothetical protein JKX84_07185 [Flavobacteriales bacterium]|nr:hypothetical protein [Flavobacteriales bacterium]
MKQIIKYLLLAVVLLPFHIAAQNPISLEYVDVVLREEFSSQNENWPYMTTMENLYVPDKDEYFMHRRQKSNPYAIISNWQNTLSTFNILTTLKLGPTDTKEQTIGVIFLVQGDGKGAIVFEFNKFKQYRIKQLVGAYYRFLSGDNEGQGWVRSSQLAAKNDYNEIDIRVDLPQVDIYLNKKFLQSFDVPDYKPGNLGFLIGADTKAKSDYFYVYTTPEAVEKAETETKKKKDNRSAVQQLSKMRYELEQKKRTLHECELERQAAVGTLEDELANLRESNDRLSLRNRQLQAFKDQVLVEVDEDVFLTLAENLKTEIIKNQKLESQVNIYKDSLKLTHVKYSRLKLALLDKAIRRAEKEKVARDKKEALETKNEIEKELKDNRMNKEQEAWEKKNEHDPAKPITEVVEEPTAEVETEITTSAPVEVAKEIEEARPLPVKVRKAQKKQD